MSAEETTKVAMSKEDCNLLEFLEMFTLNMQNSITQKAMTEMRILKSGYRP